MPLDPYVEAGLPAGFILKMISVNGAQLLGIADERGRIAPGFAADIIATSGNPLEDISVTSLTPVEPSPGLRASCRHFDRLTPH